MNKVKKFQLDNSLNIDGVVNQETWLNIKKVYTEIKIEKYVKEGKYEASELFYFDKIEDLIKYFEGKKLKAYDSPLGSNLKIGYGHAGPEVQRGMIINEETAEELFKKDLEKAKIAVSKIIQGTRILLNQKIIDVLVSLVFTENEEKLINS